MSIQVICPSCAAMFNAPDNAAGKRAKCPKCSGTIPIPGRLVAAEVVDAQEDLAASPTDADSDAMAPAIAVATTGERKPCPKCGEMIQKVALKCRFCGEVFDPALVAYQRSMRSQRPGTDKALYLHIPVSRLIILSILTSHLYEAYWIYKNWQYLKNREGLAIWPFVRGIFGIFFCHNLLIQIEKDPEARAVELPTFSPGALATGWVVLMLLNNAFSRVPSPYVGLLTFMMPSFLCLVPVQKYVNSVTERRNPGEPYYRWSAGHIVCIVLGLFGWFGVAVEIIAGDLAQ